MNNVTLCLTMGRRPELLRQTLTGLFANAQFDSVIAINDFRDEQTNTVFQEMCPHGQLISLDRQLGHHAAVDYMYSKVKTPWIFHCEDDWLFQKPIDLQHLIKVLQAQQWMSGICMRQRSDFVLSLRDEEKVLFERYDDLAFYRLDPIHAQWHGYTFNPHLASIDLWHSIGPFSAFKKERHISCAIRKKGLIVPYWVDGGCAHLGENDSVSNPATSKKSILKHWFGL
ncbi:MAG: hypothetical protein FJ210_03460 [Betaproteobacteria bacterium]|nr:hypothetical protein [Betaproteobacteria bacterium]